MRRTTRHYQAYPINWRTTLSWLSLYDTEEPSEITPVLLVRRNNPRQNWREKIQPFKMAVHKRDTAFNELFIKPIQGLYLEHTITTEEFKDRNASVMKNRWIDTQHGSAGEKIYELYDPENEGELVKESFQEWLCDNRNEITQCIGIALRNHEKSYAEWFRYVDSRSGPDELALYGLSRKYGIQTAVFNKGYVWTTLADHVLRSDEEIISLCGVNLLFFDETTYGIIRKIWVPNPIITEQKASVSKSHPKTSKKTCRESTRNKNNKSKTEQMTKPTTGRGKKARMLSESRQVSFGIHTWTHMKVDQNLRVCSRYLGHVTSVWNRHPNFCGSVWRPYYSIRNMWSSFTSIIITYTVASTFMPQPLLWKSAIFAMNKYICLRWEKC